MSVRRRGKNWVASAYDPRLRRKVWLGTFDKQGEAKDAFNRATGEFKSAHRAGTETIESFAERWQRDYPRTKESTSLHYEQQIKALVRDFGPKLLTEITRTEARQWSLKNQSWRAARAMFTDAKRDGLCTDNPFAGMRLPEARGRKDLVVPTEDEMAHLFELAGEVHGAYGERVYANLLRFAAYTGLRLGELSGLGWQHVDLRTRTVYVERQWNPKLRKMTLPKNGLKRYGHLPHQAVEALEQLPRQREDAVFCAPRGARFGGAVSHYYFHPVRCAWGKPDFDFHGLRHFYGSHLAMLGVGPVEIAKAMGHTDGGKTAMARYIHMTDQHALARVAQAFGSSQPSLAVVRGANGEQEAVEHGA